jgi:hypothetical protein
MPRTEPLTAQEIKDLFPGREEPPSAGVFELGLVLGGTVSAGAYTAGVLDFLIEALDTWTAARDSGDPDAPSHAVQLTGIAGTSGGGINGAIATRALRYGFPPVRRATQPADRARNPLYDLWVNRIGIGDFLETSDLDAGLPSLLNSGKLAAIATGAVRFVGAVRDPRPWLATPFRLFAMVANLRGIPYRIAFSGETGLAHDLVEHADSMRFALTGLGAETKHAVRPDEFRLDHTSEENWDVLAGAALATSAFPLAFQARPLRRPMEHLLYRVVVTAGDGGGPAEVRAIIPTWSALAGKEGMLPADYAFYCVDGGAMNNEPIDVMRTFLAGMTARNPRNGAQANRAMILVDPFSDPESLDPTCDPDRLRDQPVPLLGTASALLNTWVYNSRFKPVDLALAQDPDTYSRFLIAPTGPAADPAKPGAIATGMSAIASGGLGGFLGFFDPAFVRYDFLLGRRNCQRFLARYLLVPAENPIVGNVWTDRQRALHRIGNGADALYPVVPLMGPCRIEETLEDWPRGKLDPASLEERVRRRLTRVLAAASEEAIPKDPLLHVLVKGYLALGENFAKTKLTELVMDRIRAALEEKFL